MEIGSFVLTWAAIPLILSMTGYFLVAVGFREFRLSARMAYVILFALAFIAFIDLFRLFVTDQFQFSYVTSYSSSELSNSWPHFYKISALWAGQQGTFLLWLVFGIILGFWVKSKSGENEGWVMFFYILGQTFLLVLALISDPFEKLDFMPIDGQGLNPLLQNYWMQIHPPIVFVGFAAACIPFAFAMASLATNKYNDWVKQTMPWAVFTVVTLGLGIFLGGYWAYETLGWGGYWAWDPVENSSLIPWLVAIALVHGMVVEKSRGTWRRTNLFLAITMFLLIIYGTFLTRSGVLADFSVHSFADLGYNHILWASVIIMGAISYGLWGYRAARMKVTSSSGTEIFSQEFSTFLSMVLLLPFTLLVLFWTSFPLITTILSKIPFLSRISPTPAAIDTSNYNMVGLIFSIIFCVILGFNALMGWRKTDMKLLWKRLTMPAIIALAGSVIFIILGFSKIAETWSPSGLSEITPRVISMALLYFLFFLTASFSLITNFIFMVNRWKTNFRASGGYITHVGFSLMLIGIIFSSSFGNREKVSISEGDTKPALGYAIQFSNHERTGPKEQRTDFELTKGVNIIKAHTLSKEMIRENQTHFVRTPYIERSLFSDLYISMENLMDPAPTDIKPFNLHVGDTAFIFGTSIIFDGYDSDENARKLAKQRPQIIDLTKGQTFTINGRSVTFEEFEMSQHQGGMAGQIGAKLNIEYGSKSTIIIPSYKPIINADDVSEPVKFPGGGKISLIQIKADIGAVVLLYMPMNEIPNIDVGARLTIVTGSDTTKITPIFNPAEPHGENSVVKLPDGSHMILNDLNPKDNLAQLLYHPEKIPLLATIEISTKPMINLVWIGFLMVVGGATVAILRRMSEN